MSQHTAMICGSVCEAVRRREESKDGMRKKKDLGLVTNPVVYFFLTLIAVVLLPRVIQVEGTVV